MRPIGAVSSICVRAVRAIADADGADADGADADGADADGADADGAGVAAMVLVSVVIRRS
ncbi:hypothetical protein [Minwuia sp. IMCC3060]|uniref:hypothetical protein n=1 Tax=Minwuia sp. IMCC3060 TaxID=3040675 RepID=UPI002478FB31|nr:hypothetical protein [Minwuia sp. IMCC3060]